MPTAPVTVSTLVCMAKRSERNFAWPYAHSLSWTYTETEGGRIQPQLQIYPWASTTNKAEQGNIMDPAVTKLMPFLLLLLAMQGQAARTD